ANTALHPHRPDRPELQHHHGNRDPGHPPRPRGRGARAVHLPLQSDADEEGDQGGTRGDGPRLRPLRAGAVRRARGRARLRLPRRHHEHGQGLPPRVRGAPAPGHGRERRRRARGDERRGLGGRPARARREEDLGDRALHEAADAARVRLHRGRGHRGARPDRAGDRRQPGGRRARPARVGGHPPAPRRDGCGRGGAVGLRADALPRRDPGGRAGLRGAGRVRRGLHGVPNARPARAQDRGAERGHAAVRPLRRRRRASRQPGGL
ncbi:MAG: Maleate cis-trans isomerase, partial [uncultured Acetobacteraceae bacterium]